MARKVASLGKEIADKWDQKLESYREARSEIEAALDSFRAVVEPLKESLEKLRDQWQESLDNMSDRWQESDPADEARERMEQLENLIAGIEETLSNLDVGDLYEPEFETFHDFVNP